MKKVMILLLLIPIVGFTGSQKYFVSPSDESARLILQPNKSTQQLFPVTLQSVNGNQVASRGSAVWMKPGEYELSFTAAVDLTTTKGTFTSNGNRRSNKLQNKLMVNLEADKTYYIAFEAKGIDRSQWKPVVWKTE
ncbi:hypothetical protein [Marinicella sp. W31]|uniref:hypothetical protein n=1 Tax=Marinicella sp. W31 TaxID=3023713 RepID=UPI0037564CAF